MKRASSRVLGSPRNSDLRSPADAGRTGKSPTPGTRREEPSSDDHSGADSAQDRRRLAGEPGWPAPQVAEALDVAKGTVYRIKRRFVEDGLEGALWERTQAHRYRKLDDRGEAHLVALACSPAPEGHDHWTLRLLAGKVVELGLASSMSHEGVRQRLKKTLSSRGRRKSGASPR